MDDVEDERTVSVLDSDQVLGVNYALKLEESNEELMNYSDELLSNMLCDFADMSINSGVNLSKLYSTKTVVFDTAKISDLQKAAQYIEQRAGIAVAKAVYTSLFDTVCNLSDEESIWEAIASSVTDEYFNFETVNDTYNSVDNIKTLWEFASKIADNSNTRVQYNKLRYSILDNIQAYTAGVYSDLDGSKATAEAGYKGLFAVQGAERKSIESDISDVEISLGEVFDIATKGLDLLNSLHGIKDSNTHRAILNMMLEEDEATARDILEKAAKEMHSTIGGGGDEYMEIYFANMHGEDLEEILKKLPNANINALYARMAGVNLTELLYKDLLKTTMDAAYSYYTGYIKGLM